MTSKRKLEEKIAESKDPVIRKQLQELLDSRYNMTPEQRKEYRKSHKTAQVFFAVFIAIIIAIFLGGIIGVINIFLEVIQQ